MRLSELGETLSGEHGIGILKAPYMKKELGHTTSVKAIKEAWDPNGRFNSRINT
nr:FAD-linked oxidase C-terminal domain-containing protein [Bacillus sp. V2I10]